MRQTLLLLLALQLLAFDQTSFGQKDNLSLRRQVEDLVKRFDASTLSERSRAERELLELGPDALPYLPASDLIESVSARESLRRLRIELERRAARDSSDASQVTLRGEFPLAEIVKQIELQTKNRISLEVKDELKTKPLMVDWDKSAFWVVVDELCRLGAVSWAFSKDQSTVVITNAAPTPSPAAVAHHSGAFRVSIDGIELRPIFGDESQRLIRINGRIAVEPRIRPLFLSMAAKSLKAVDQDRRSLNPWNEEAKYEIPAGDGSHEIRIQWDFRLPTGQVIERISLKGEMRCEIAAARERVVFDLKSLYKGVVRRRGGVSVRLRDVQVERDAGKPTPAEIGVTVSYDTGGPAFESHRAWMFYNAAYFETSSGERIDFDDNDTSQQADGAVAIDYRWNEFSLSGDSFRFVYEAPTLIMNVPINVEISDLRVEEPVK